MNRRHLTWLGAAAILLAALAVYLPVFRCGFIWDDNAFVTDSALIHAPDGLYRFWFTTEPPDYFPLTSTTLWLEWRLWGRNAAGFHGTNLALFLGTCLLLWALLRRARLPEPAPWCAALLFAVHPVNVQTVAWITQRKNTLSLFFGALAVWLWLCSQTQANEPVSSSKPGAGNVPSALKPETRNLNPLLYWLSVLCFALSLLSKTALITLPAVLLLYAWWRNGRVTRADLRALAPYFALSLLLGLVTVFYQYNRSIGEDVRYVRPEGLASRALTVGWAAWFYLRKALLPTGMAFSYERWTILAQNPLHYVPGLAALAALGGLWALRRRTWARAALFTLAGYWLLLAPVLGFMNIYYFRYSLVSDHYQYAALILPLAGVAAGASLGLRRVGPAAARLLPPAACAAAAALGFYSFRYVQDYRETETLWRQTLKKTPDSALALYNLGQMLVLRGDRAEGEPLLQRSIPHAPRMPDVYVCLASLRVEEGKLDEGLDLLHRCLAMHPNYAKALMNVGVILQKQKKPEEALPWLQRAVRYAHGDPLPYHNLGTALSALGRPDEAERAFAQALAIDPVHVPTLVCLGELHLKMRNPQAAGGALQQALRLSPTNAAAHLAMADLRFVLKEYPQALESYRAAARLAKDPLDARCRGAMVLHRLRRSQEALGELRGLLREHPEDGHLHYTLALILRDAGQQDAAVEHARSAIAAAEKTSPPADMLMAQAARILAAAGQREDALRALRRAAQANPAHAAELRAAQERR